MAGIVQRTLGNHVSAVGRRYLEEEDECAPPATR